MRIVAWHIYCRWYKAVIEQNTVQLSLMFNSIWKKNNSTKVQIKVKSVQRTVHLIDHTWKAIIREDYTLFWEQKHFSSDFFSIIGKACILPMWPIDGDAAVVFKLFSKGCWNYEYILSGLKSNSLKSNYTIYSIFCICREYIYMVWKKITCVDRFSNLNWKSGNNNAMEL